MSNISGDRRRYARIEYEVPLRGCQPSSTSDGARDIYGLLGRMEEAAKEPMTGVANRVSSPKR